MCYFSNATQKTQITVDLICHELKNPKFGQANLVVGTGFSGTLLLAAIHLQSGIPFVAIRKDTIRTNSVDSVELGGIEQLDKTKKYIIIDDFVESGATIRKIQKEMSDHECVGIILYQCDRAFLEKFTIDVNIKMHDNRRGTLDNIPLATLCCDVEEIEEEAVSIV